MIDIHSHLLPLVDDGSDSVETSLTLLRECEEMGVTDVVLTPHYKNPYKKTPEELKEVFNSFVKRKEENGIVVNLYLGSELHDSKNLKSRIKNGEVLTINGTKFVLVEFDYFNRTDITETIYSLVHSGYVPIIAHAERYVYFTLDEVIEAKSLGALVQVNASSIVGDAGKGSKKFARKLFKNSLVDFVASDMHMSRTNYLLEAKKIVEKKYGKDIAEKVFCENAKSIIGQA